MICLISVVPRQDGPNVDIPNKLGEDRVGVRPSRLGSCEAPCDERGQGKICRYRR